MVSGHTPRAYLPAGSRAPLSSPPKFSDPPPRPGIYASAKPNLAAGARYARARRVTRIVGVDKSRHHELQILSVKVVQPEACTKCGGERTGTHPRWCLGCRKAARERGNAVVTAGNGGIVTALRARVTELEEEVARLKRALAGRPTTETTGSNTVVTPVTVSPLAGCEVGPCIHGGVYGRCRLLGCKPAPKTKGKPS